MTARIRRTEAAHRRDRRGCRMGAMAPSPATSPETGASAERDLCLPLGTIPDTDHRFPE